MASVSGLTVYPLKGAKGIHVQRAKLASTGFVWDRNWVIVREGPLQFESQRKDPKMALIEASLPKESFTEALQPDQELSLTLDVPGQEPFKVPVGAGRSQQRSKCNVWEWTGEGFDEGDMAAEYLSDFMGHKVRLIRYAGDPSQSTPEEAEERRALNPDFAPPHTETAFSDAMPYMIANEASLAELNSRCPENIPMDRFRPNIVVREAEAWEEDTWAKLKIGDIEFAASSPNGRCVVTTVDQVSGVRQKSNEPLKTLMTYRKGTTLGFTADKSWKNLVFFGWYLIASQGGVLSVDDPLQVLGRRDGPPQTWGAA